MPEIDGKDPANHQWGKFWQLCWKTVKSKHSIEKPFLLKGAPQGLRKSIKDEKYFLFDLESSFFNFLSWIFGHVGKRLHYKD